MWVIVITMISLGSICALGQPAVDLQLVSENIEYFEHLLTSVARTPELNRKAFTDSLRLSDSQVQVLVTVSVTYGQREDALRERVLDAIERGDHDEAARAKSERVRLLEQAALQLLLDLSPDGAKGIKDRLAKYKAMLPQRVK